MESSSQASHVFGDLEMESHVSSSKSSSLSYGLSSSSSSLVDPYEHYKMLADELYKVTGINIGDFKDTDEHALLTKELNDEFGIDVGIEDLVKAQHPAHDRGLWCSSSYSKQSCILANTPCTDCHDDNGRICCGCSLDWEWIYQCSQISSISSHSSSTSYSSSSVLSSSRLSSSISSSDSQSSSSRSQSSSSMTACGNWNRGDYVRVEARSGQGSTVMTPFEGWVTGPPGWNGSCEAISVQLFKWNNGSSSFGLSNGCCYKYDITSASPCDCARGTIQAGDSITSWPAHGSYSAGNDPNGLVNDVYVIQTSGADEGKLGVDIVDSGGSTVWVGPCRLL